MRNTLIGFLIAVSTCVFSQKNELPVLNKDKNLGKNLITNTEITGSEYVFPDRIHETYLDTVSGFLTVQIRGLSKNGKWLDNTGNILLYDLNKRTLKWSRKIAYQASSLQQFSNTIIFTTANKSYCLDINSGAELWEVKNNIYFVDPTENIGIGYRFKGSTGYSNELEGINLANGEVLWKKMLIREYGWNDLFYLNDSTLVIVSSGLHTINLKDGTGWDYHTITGKNDYTGTAIANAAGVAAGLLTGTFVMSTGHNVVRDIVSNVLVDSTDLYFSSREKLSRIDKQTGNVIWSHPFPNDLPSKSSIFFDDSLVFMINRGFAFMGYRQLDFGKPFIAAFDKKSGKQVFLTLIDGKEDQVLGFKIKENELYLVFKNRMSKYSKSSGNLITDEAFSAEEFGELNNFIGNQVYITDENNSFSCLPESDTTQVFVFTNNNKILAVDSQLNVTKTINYEDLSIYYLRSDDYKFIAKENQTWILDLNGLKVAEIEATSNAFLIGNTLYDQQNDSFIAIDLTEILKKQ
jgi:outer membrane protein assembly factor BamB